MKSVRDFVTVGDLHRARHQPARFQKGVISRAVRDFKIGWDSMGSRPKQPAPAMHIGTTGAGAAHTTMVSVNARPAQAGGFTCKKHGNYLSANEHRIDAPNCRFGPRVKTPVATAAPTAAAPVASPAPNVATPIQVGTKVPKAKAVGVPAIKKPRGAAPVKVT
jgi:hypothetical protein